MARAREVGEQEKIVEVVRQQETEKREFEIDKKRGRERGQQEWEQRESEVDELRGS